MLCGVKFRAYPGASLKQGLRQWIGHQRFIRNAKVREDRYFAKFARLCGEHAPADQAYSQFITEETQFLRAVPSQILRNGAYRHATARRRYQVGLAGAPRIAKKSGRQSVLITSELFEFSGEYSNIFTRKLQRDLHLGTKKHPLGRLAFKAHRPYEIPKMLCVAVEPSGEWFVSFCYETPAAQDALVLRTPEELAYEFAVRPDLEAITIGIDRGAVLPFAASDGASFVLPEINATRIVKYERQAARYQRRMARQIKGSRRRSKSAQRLARAARYGRNARCDFAHKTSFTLTDSKQQIFVFEDLKLKNMTAAPHPKKDAVGRWAPNGSAAKAQLNKRLLAGSLGRVLQYCRYKAAARNKLVLTVSAAYSSQECSACGRIDAANRRSQAEFLCVACGFCDNADHNAACVLKKRGIAQLKAGLFRPKEKKTARVRGRNGLVGQVLPEPEETPTSEESAQDGVRGMVPARSARGSGKPPLQPIAA